MKTGAPSIPISKGTEMNKQQTERVNVYASKGQNLIPKKGQARINKTIAQQAVKAAKGK